MDDLTVLHHDQDGISITHFDFVAHGSINDRTERRRRTSASALAIGVSARVRSVIRCFFLVAYKLSCPRPDPDRLSTLEFKQQMEVISLDRLRKRHGRISRADSGNRSNAVIFRVWQFFVPWGDFKVFNLPEYDAKLFSRVC